MKLISIVTSCYNEAENIEELHSRITAVMAKLSQYDYEIICIDNCSIDGTPAEIRKICKQDKKFKAIFNVRNFGHIRAPWHALMQIKGDAAIAMCSDLEDPPELIPDLIKKWEEGYKLALAVRESSAEKGIWTIFRKAYYKIIQKISNIEQITGFTGFGLYDREVVDTFKSLEDPYPYSRGLVCELGWKRAEIPFHKPVRKRGFSKGNFWVYLDTALLGIVNHSKVPIRLVTITGIAVSALSFLAGIYYLVRKLLNWDLFQAGLAPITVSMFFLFGLLFFFLGLIGEYIGLLVTHVVKRPLVVEEERLNFDTPDE